VLENKSNIYAETALVRNPEGDSCLNEEEKGKVMNEIFL